MTHEEQIYRISEKIARVLQYIASANALIVNVLKLLAEDGTINREVLVQALNQTATNNKDLVGALRIVGTLK
jgi:hypothetical protein